MSLKQKGNQAYNSHKYKQAIKLYEEYVAQQHSDNKNAFFNMGLCYSKLKDHQKSIEACKSAISLDPTYEKVYYRLMKEYFQVNNPYEIFINARLFIKNSKNQQTEEYKEAKKNMKTFKDYFINRLVKEQAPKKLEEKDEIFQLIEPLRPSKSEDFNEQVDKYPNQWIEEWLQDIQSDDAKWEQIAFIIRELDYDTGISLAYFYLNQITIPAKRRDLVNRIRDIKKELNKEPSVVDDDVYNEIQNQHLQTDVKESSFEKEQDGSLIQPLKTNDKKEPILKNQQIICKQSPVQIVAEDPKKPEKVNKIQELLQKKSQNKKMYEQNNEGQVLPQKSKLEKKESQKNTKSEQPKTTPKTVEIKQQKAAQQAVRQEQGQQQLLQGKYKSYCGNLQITKDIFVELYRSIFQILKGKQPSTTIGKLLILIKKRVKKFKMIVASFSDNQQKAIFDLLSKKNMEEYAVDFAPKYHKV